MNTSVAGVQPGDILAVRSPGWGASMIRLGAALLDKPDISSHVAVVHHRDASGTLWCIEGRPGGVGWRNARDYVSSPWTLSNRDQPKTGAQRKVIADGAMAILGMPYDWAAIIGDGLDDLHLWSPVNGQVRGHAVCSAVAAFLYDKASLARPRGGERSVQPADWDEFLITRAWSPS
jgi:hypothetical protein